MSAGGSKKVIIISLCANLGIAFSKLFGAIFTGSAAMLAESVHSFSDCGNQALLLWGGYQAKKEPSRKYPMGHGKEMFFWSFVVALMLFSLGGMFSLYEGIHKIENPAPLKYPMVAVSILLVAILLEGFSFFACLKEIQRNNPHANLWIWVRQTMAADMLVIFLEDLAALLGLLIALTALTATWLTGNSLWDGIGSCTIGLLLIVVAIILAREVKPMLIGERPFGEYESGMHTILMRIMPEAKIIKMIALQQGVDAVMFAYKIHPGETPRDMHAAIGLVNEFEAQVKLAYPEVKWQFAELDVKD